MEQDDVLSTLRSLPEEREPLTQEKILQVLSLQTRLLEDIKLKLDINNEVLLELLELRKRKAYSDHGAQVRPIRNKPFPSRPRHRSETRSY